MKKSVNPVGLAVIGCGRIAGVHVQNLARMKKARIVALVDSDPGAARKLQRFALQAAVCSTLSESLSLPGVDAVLICLPPADHAEAACKALDAGKHVYLEKPIATHLNEAEGLLRKAGVAERIAMVGFNFRFHEPVLKLKQQIRKAEAGEILAVRTSFCSSTARGIPAWKQKTATGGGVLLDLGSHHFDLMPFLFDSKISRVSARVWSHRYEEDAAFVDWQLENGARIQSYFSMSGRDEDRIEMYGGKRTIVFDRFRSPGILQRISRSGFEPSYLAAMRSFFQCIEFNRPAAPSLQDGFESLLAVHAARWSHEQNTPAMLQDLRREDFAHP